jgi:hypothetical protein
VSPRPTSGDPAWLGRSGTRLRRVR